MTAPALITTGDLAAWLGDEVDEPRAGAVIDGVSAFIRSHTTDDWISDVGVLEPVPPAVRQVAVQVAARAYRGGRTAGVAQETMGPFSTSFVAAGQLGDLFLTKNEKKMLRPWMATTTGLWTLATTRVDAELGLTDYRPVVDPGADPIPMFGPSDLGPPI